MEGHSWALRGSKLAKCGRRRSCVVKHLRLTLLEVGGSSGRDEKYRKFSVKNDVILLVGVLVFDVAVSSVS